MTSSRDPIPAVLAALGTLLVLVAVSALLGLLGPSAVGDVRPHEIYEAPSLQHWLGTDRLGRDVATRLVLAIRYFTFPGAISMAVGLGIAVPLGALAGYYGGIASTIARGLGAVVSAVPVLVGVVLVCAIVADSLWVLAIAAGVLQAPGVLDEVHDRVERSRSGDFVLAHRAHGVPEWRILWVHLVGVQCARLLARQAVTLFGSFVVLEATLSYLGSFGVEEPTPSWGNMLVRDSYASGASWTSALAPAVALYVVMFGTWVFRSIFREVARD